MQGMSSSHCKISKTLHFLLITSQISIFVDLRARKLPLVRIESSLLKKWRVGHTFLFSGLSPGTDTGSWMTSGGAQQEYMVLVSNPGWGHTSQMPYSLYYFSSPNWRTFQRKHLPSSFPSLHIYINILFLFHF